MKILLVGFSNVHVECKECGRAFGTDFSEILPAADCLESSVILYTHCAVIQCVISLFSPLCLPGWRHKGCVEHPKAICFNKMTQFVYTLITEPGRQQDQSLTVIIHDTRCLWSRLWRAAEPSITFLQQFLWETHHVHPCCQGLLFNETCAFMLLVVSAVLKSNHMSSLHAVQNSFQCHLQIYSDSFAILKVRKRFFLDLSGHPHQKKQPYRTTRKETYYDP